MYWWPGRAQYQWRINSSGGSGAKYIWDPKFRYIEGRFCYLSWSWGLKKGPQKHFGALNWGFGDPQCSCCIKISNVLNSLGEFNIFTRDIHPNRTECAICFGQFGEFSAWARKNVKSCLNRWNKNKIRIGHGCVMIFDTSIKSIFSSQSKPT